MFRKKVKVVVVGSLNMDQVNIVPRMPAIGETIIATKSFTSPGGKGVNQAVTASRLNGEVEMIGCVGNDKLGRELIDTLKQEKINVDNIAIVEGAQTGQAFITLSEDGENSIVVSPGANKNLSPAMIKEKENVIKYADIMLVQLEVPIETVQEAINYAIKHNVKIILNPAPVISVPLDILKKVDILTPNESEGKLLIQLKAKEEISATKVIKQLKSLGPNKIALTQGKDGVLTIENNYIRHMPAFKVDVVDTTGAGDAFNGALAIAYAQGNSFIESVEFAQEVASMTVTKYGAITALPFHKQIKK